MTTTEDTTIEKPTKGGWTRDSSQEVITRFAEGEAPYHMCEPAGSQQLALLLQVICKELQELSNEVVVLQNEELLRYRLVKEIMSPKKGAS